MKPKFKTRREREKTKLTNSFNLHSETNQTPYHKDGRLDTVKAPLISCAFVQPLHLSSPSAPSRNLKTKQIDLTWPQFYRQLLESALYIPLSRSLSYLYETQYLRFQPLDGILIYSFLLATSSQPVSLSVLFVLFFFSLSSGRKHIQQPGRKKDTSINIVIVKMVSSQLAMQFSDVSRRHGGQWFAKIANVEDFGNCQRLTKLS